MDRFWLLTWTTYGSWLPGDERGFVGPVRIADGVRDDANQFQTEPHSANSHLEVAARTLLKQAPVLLSLEQAGVLMDQLRETAEYRGWTLIAAAVMANHVHLVVVVPDDPEPSSLLRDFKSYGSRALNRTLASGSRQKWWTEHGSNRKLADKVALTNAVRYVVNQQVSLVVWHDEKWLRTLLPAALQFEENHRGD